MQLQENNQQCMVNLKQSYFSTHIAFFHQGGASAEHPWCILRNGPHFDRFFW